jgi:hypothetical protein
MAHCVAIKTVDVVVRVDRGKIISVDREIEIFGFDRPVAAEHFLDAAANGVTPLEILMTSIMEYATARRG